MNKLILKCSSDVNVNYEPWKIRASSGKTDDLLPSSGLVQNLRLYNRARNLNERLDLISSCKQLQK